MKGMRSASVDDMKMDLVPPLLLLLLHSIITSRAVAEMTIDAVPALLDLIL